MEHENILPKEVQVVANNNSVQLKFDNSFQQMCNDVRQVIDRTNHLATLQNVDEANTDEVETAIKDLTVAQKKQKEITGIRAATKKWLTTNFVDRPMAQIDQTLQNAGFNELQSRDAQAKQLKKDLSALRKKRHWTQVEDTFNANIANYPLISQLAPKLTNFQLFQIRHPKLVTGAKNWRFGDKQMAEVNQYLYDINFCLTDLNDNTTNLPSRYRNGIYSAFIGNPTKEAYLETKNRAINQYQIDQERAKQIKLQQEQQKQAQAQQQVNNAQTQQTQAQAQQTMQQPQTMEQRALTWLNDYLMMQSLTYPHIANDNHQKTKLIYDLVHQLDNPKSKFYLFLKDSEDPEKMELVVLRQILLF